MTAGGSGASATVIGATGVLGPPVVRALASCGHHVRAVTRTPPASGQLPVGTEVAAADLLHPDALARAIRGSDVIVNLASAVPRSSAPTPDDWRRNDRVREDGTRHLLRAMEAEGVARLLQAGVHLVYGLDRRDELLGEDAALDPPSVVRSAVTAERMLVAASGWGLRATSLRLGWLHAATSWHARSLLGDLRDGHLVLPHDRRWWWSTTSADTVAAVIAALVSTGTEASVLHVVDGPAVVVDQLLPAVAAERRWPAPRSGGGGDARLRRSVRLDASRCDAVLGREPSGPERTIAALAATARELDRAFEGPADGDRASSAKKKKRRHPLDIGSAVGEDAGSQEEPG